MKNYIVLIFCLFLVNISINLSLRYFDIPGVDCVNLSMLAVYGIMLLFLLHNDKFGKWMRKDWKGFRIRKGN